jgi:hypothetical protein
MDIELRNTLGALTSQIQELTKQSKALDGTLAGALDKGSKSANGLAAGTRAVRTEMSLVSDVSEKVSQAWGRQLLQFTIGATSVTALWQTVSAAMQESQQRLPPGIEQNGSGFRIAHNLQSQRTHANYSATDKYFCQDITPRQKKGGLSRNCNGAKNMGRVRSDRPDEWIPNQGGTIQ